MPEVNLDLGTARAIDKLRRVFGVRHGIDVIRKSVALARIAERNAEAGVVTLVDQNGEQIKVQLGSHSRGEPKEVVDQKR